MISKEQLCMRCMAEVLTPGGICPNCGASADKLSNAPHQLPLGTLLDNAYLVGCAMGQGGFGITYIGWDTNLDIKVAIKEYYPEGCVGRDATRNTTLLPITGKRGEYFEAGRERFVQEAKVLAKFSGEPGIVGVRSFFLENGTAYIVMDFVAGQTLKKYAEGRGGRLSAREALSLLKPLFYAMDKVHAAGLLHRDISPDNIMLQPDGTVKLLDFGAARQMSSMGEHSNTVNVKPGFAPEEQYRTRGEQGPWTDVYALAATVYRLTTGVTPPQSLDRQMGSEVLKPPRALGADLTPAQEEALLTGLAVLGKDRFQSMRAFYNALYSDFTPGFAQTTPAGYTGRGPAAPCTGQGGAVSGPSTGGYPNSGRGPAAPYTGQGGAASGPSTGGYPNSGRGPAAPCTGQGGAASAPSTGGYPNSGRGPAAPYTGQGGAVSGPSTGGYPSSGRGPAAPYTGQGGAGASPAGKTKAKPVPIKLIALIVWGVVCVAGAALLIQRGCKSDAAGGPSAAQAAPAQATLGPEGVTEAPASQQEAARQPEQAPTPAQQPGPAVEAYRLTGGAYTYTQDGLTYDIYSNGAKLTGCQGDEPKVLVIPEEVSGVPVTVIGEEAFFCCSDIESLTLPSTLKVIEKGAFLLSWRFKELTLPQGLTEIQSNAFESCSFVRLNIPASLHTLEEDAFIGCDAVESISVEEGNLWFTTDGQALFSNGGTELALYAAASPQTAYAVPEGVIKIQPNAFKNNWSLERVSLPASLQTADGGFTEAYSLKEIAVDGGSDSFQSIDGVLYSADGKVLVQFPCNSPKELMTVPQGVETIAAGAFSYAFELKKVVLPDGVRYIRQGAFQFSSLEEIVLPEGLISIDSRAFSYCEKLPAINLPSTLTSIGEEAFESCVLFKTVTLPQGVTSVGKYAFAYCKGLTQLHIPPTVTDIGDELVFSSDDVTIYGVKGSQAEIYAQQADIPFHAE